jgi:hypothetical protein
MIKSILAYTTNIAFFALILLLLSYGWFFKPMG